LKWKVELKIDSCYLLKAFQLSILPFSSQKYFRFILGKVCWRLCSVDYQRYESWRPGFVSSM